MDECAHGPGVGAPSIEGVLACPDCGARLINPRLNQSRRVECVACRASFQPEARQGIRFHEGNPSEANRAAPAESAPAGPEPASPNYALLILFGGMCGLALLCCALPWIQVLRENRMSLREIDESTLLMALIVVPTLTGAAVLAAALLISQLDRLTTRLAWRSGWPLCAPTERPYFFLFSLAPICIVGGAFTVVGLVGVRDYWGLAGIVVAGLGLLTAFYGLALEELHRFLRRLSRLVQVVPAMPPQVIDHSPTFSFFILFPGLVSGAATLLGRMPRSPDGWLLTSSCAFLSVLCWGLFVLSRSLGPVAGSLGGVRVGGLGGKGDLPVRWRLYRQLPWYAGGLALAWGMAFAGRGDAMAFLLTAAFATIWLAEAVLTVRRLCGGLRHWAVERTAVFVDRSRSWQECLAGIILAFSALAVLSAVFVRPGLLLPLLVFAGAWWCVGAGLVTAELSRTRTVLEEANRVVKVGRPADR